MNLGVDGTLSQARSRHNGAAKNQVFVTQRSMQSSPQHSSALPPLVAHVIFRLAVGGLENGLVNLLNRLPRSEFRHAVVCIDDFTDFRNRIDRDDIEIIAIKKKPGTDTAALLRLYRVFRKLRPQIVHTRNLAALDALLPAFLAGVRVRIHGEHGWDIGDVDANSRKQLWLRRIHAPLITKYIAVSHHLESYLTRSVGVNGSRVIQVYNGVDTSKFRRVEPYGRAHLPIREKFGEAKLLIGTVGRIDPVKDQLSLIEAFSDLLNADSELRQTIRLIVVGDGPLMDQVVARVASLGLSDVVWLPGARNDIHNVLQSLDIFVLPSLAEGISNTILEAMACSLPVVATNVGGNTELVDDGVTGCLVESGSPVALGKAIASYVYDRELRLAHGRAGRAVVEDNFGLDKMVNTHRNIYSSFLD